MPQVRVSLAIYRRRTQRRKRERKERKEEKTRVEERRNDHQKLRRSSPEGLLSLASIARLPFFIGLQPDHSDFDRLSGSSWSVSQDRLRLCDLRGCVLHLLWRAIRVDRGKGFSIGVDEAGARLAGVFVSSRICKIGGVLAL